MGDRDVSGAPGRPEVSTVGWVSPDEEDPWIRNDPWRSYAAQNWSDIASSVGDCGEGGSAAWENWRNPSHSWSSWSPGRWLNHSDDYGWNGWMWQQERRQDDERNSNWSWRPDALSVGEDRRSGEYHDQVDVHRNDDG